MKKIGVILGAAAALALCLWFGVRLKALLGMLLWAGVIAYLLLPLARKWGALLPPAAAAAASLGTALLAGGALAWLLVPGFIDQGKELVAQLPGMMAWLRERLAALDDWCQSQLGFTLKLSSRLLGEGLAQTLAGYLRAIPMPDTQGIANALLVPLFAYYLLKDRERIRQGALYLIPGCWRGDVTRIMERVHRGLTGYLRGQLWVALFVGLLTGVGLYVAQVPYALILGLTMMLCNVIPYFGPFLGAAPIAVVAAAAGRLVGALAAVIVVQQLENIVISPRVMGNSLKMNPLVVMVSVLAGGMLWGVGGMLFALPAVIIAREWTSYFMDRMTLPRLERERLIKTDK